MLDKLVEHVRSDDWLIGVSLGESHTDGGLAAEDFGFTNRIAGKVGRIVDREIRCGGIAGEAALQGGDFGVEGLDAEEGDAGGVNG